MPKTATLTVRLDPKVKREAIKVFDKLGITASQAVTLYFSQVSAENGLPFRPHIPNEETERIMEEAFAGTNLHAAKDIDDLFAQLES
ncbi:MAG: type II toxin-antitoxin system RelB/DinJ family antitoxin [Rhodobacterales bacterium]|nr:type II toxin-antitoxin system RelB/DinJ family antitoxin [Rhodobacterales bacterium]